MILDTSVLIEAERGRLNIDRLISGRESESFGLSIVSVAELLHGVHRADSENRRLKRSAFVEKIIEIFPITLAFQLLPMHLLLNIQFNP